MKLPHDKQHVFFFLKDGEPDHEGQTAFFGWFDAENAQFIIEGETAYEASSVRLWICSKDAKNIHIAYEFENFKDYMQSVKERLVKTTEATKRMDARKNKPGGFQAKPGGIVSPDVPDVEFIISPNILKPADRTFNPVGGLVLREQVFMPDILPNYGCIAAIIEALNSVQVPDQQNGEPLDKSTDDGF